MGAVPAPKGFSGAGTFSLDALCCGVGVGMLDGILFSNGKGSVIVTTESLLRLWLEEHKDWWKDNPLATDPKTAFQSDAFYTQAITTDAAVGLFASLPIHAPAGASLAVAQLALQCNGFCALPAFHRRRRQRRKGLRRAGRRGAAPNDTQGRTDPCLRCRLEGLSRPIQSGRCGL